MKMYFVNIIEVKTGKIVKSIECTSEAKACKVEDGVSINLNWDEYETEIICKELV